MNGDTDQNELARVKDEEVELLYEICKRASLLDAPPYKALFEAYSQVLAENGRPLEHDATIFRVLIPVGRETRSVGASIDPLTAFKRLLVANNISVIDDDEDDHSKDGISATHGSIEVAPRIENIPSANGIVQEPRVDKRRVSFDDARLEETWLLENESDAGLSREGLLRLPPRRPGPYLPQRRASISSHHDLSSYAKSPPPRHFRARNMRNRPIASKHENHNAHLAYSRGRYANPLSVATSTSLQPALLIDPSRANLESDAETFAYTTELRFARRCLNVWHTDTLSRLGDRAHLDLIAMESYQRALLKAVLEAWRERLASVRKRELQRVRLENMDTCAEDMYRRAVVTRKLIKWKQSSDWQSEATARARHNLLLIRYFQLWKAVTDTNLRKARGILIRKALIVWRDRVTERKLHTKQAETLRLKSRVRHTFRAWCWQYLERKAELWRENKLKLHFAHLRAALYYHAKSRETADECHASHIKTSGISNIKRCLRNVQHVRDILVPRANNLTLQIQLSLQRRSLKIFLLHCRTARQAVDFDQHRVLQTAWSKWNDTLRTQVLKQKADERILVENLYRWVLEERCQLFRRSRDQRVACRMVSVWSERLRQVQGGLGNAEWIFAERQQRRRTASSMSHLHAKIRWQENTERRAVEFANHRVIPLVLASWTTQVDHVRALHKWATDSRFFNLTTKAIKLWHDQTEKHKVSRRRQAYVQVRARIKIRIAHSCLARMHERTIHLHTLLEQARTIVYTRVSLGISIRLIGWRQTVTRVHNMKLQAASLNHHRLIGSSFAAFFLRLGVIDALEIQAEEARRGANLDLLGATFKKMQWISFSAAQHAARHDESAEALWMRNRDTHIKRMIRVWHAQSSARLTHQAQQTAYREAEPESPSLRQASRAASRSVQHSGRSSPAIRDGNTPAYLRTPSRSRKAGRFRMVLPTPAPLTPFRFDAAYIATVPDPLDVDTSRQQREQKQEDSPRQAIDPSDLQEQGDPTLQVTAFSRKLRAGGFNTLGSSTTPITVPSVLKSRTLGPVMGSAAATTKNVRFLGASGSAAASPLRDRQKLEE